MIDACIQQLQWSHLRPQPVLTSTLPPSPALLLTHSRRCLISGGSYSWQQDTYWLLTWGSVSSSHTLHTYLHTYTYTYVYMHTHIRTYVRAYCIYICTYVRTFTASTLLLWCWCVIWYVYLCFVCAPLLSLCGCDWTAVWWRSPDRVRMDSSRNHQVCGTCREVYVRTYIQTKLKCAASAR